MAFKFESFDFKNTFQKVLNLTENYQEFSFNITEQIESILLALNKIQKVFPIDGNLSYLDEKITYAVNQDGFDFVKRVSESLNDYKMKKDLESFVDIVSKAAALIYIYLREFEFRVGEFDISRSFEVGDFKVIVGSYLKENPTYSRYIDFGDRDLEYEILKEFFFSKDIKNLDILINKQNEVEERLQKIDDLVLSYDKLLESKKSEVLGLEKRLEKSKQTYDFVLLNKGFKELYDQKKLELKERRNGYSSFGATLAITPLLLIVFSIVGFCLKGEEILKYLLYVMFPVSTFMLIILYFVRVSLQHVRSVQSQMMQLELRMALCQFIHNYADDSEKLHAKNKAGFEKFENIIFSPLVSSDDKIPTTFDGMEQLAKLVSEFRK